VACGTGSEPLFYSQRFYTAISFVLRFYENDYKQFSVKVKHTMRGSKYFDIKANRLLDLEQDGCDLAQWAQLYGKALFARHPKGFLVFLPPHRIRTCDEYANSAPRTIEEIMTNPFQKRRAEITVELLRETVSQVKENPKVLDLGCGRGYITEKMREAVDDVEITGLDYSLSAIEYAHDHFPGIDFAVGDAYDAPYAEKYFNVVVWNNLWEHVPDPLSLLSRIGFLIKPNGHLIISTPSRYRSDNLVRVLRGKPVAFMSKHHVTEYTVGQVIEQLAYGEFDVQRVCSRPIRLNSLKAELMRRLLSIMISLVGSHHQLESTVFYLAQKVSYSPKQMVVAK
jgi:2-polyprenyl-3-methyl-5-hydroxy-6-metoxy-1,4-benzoquinol methylase